MVPARLRLTQPKEGCATIASNQRGGAERPPPCEFNRPASGHRVGGPGPSPGHAGQGAPRPFPVAFFRAPLPGGRGGGPRGDLHRDPDPARGVRRADPVAGGRTGSERAGRDLAGHLRHRHRPEFAALLRRRPARPRRVRARAGRGPRLAARRLRRNGHRDRRRCHARHDRRLLPRLDRHRDLAADRRAARLPDPAARARDRERLLGRRRLLRRPRPARHEPRGLRDRLRQLDLHRPHHPRADALVAREGVRRGRQITRRLGPAHHLQGDPAQSRRADHRLHDAADPDEHPLRGLALLPRRRRPAASGELGQDDRRGDPHLRQRALVHAGAGHRAGHHGPRLQPRRRRTPGRPQPQDGSLMTRAPAQRKDLLRMSSSRRWLIGPALAAAVLVLAACGGSNNSSGNKNTAGKLAAGVNGPGKPVDGQKKGGHVTVLANGDVDYMDPGASYYQFTYGVISGVVRQLYTFKPTDTGTNPTPDMADGEPQVTDGGKTVTVHIRKGIKYSPPYGKEVKAADIKYGIERAFTPAVPNGYINNYYGGLVGVDAFKKGKAKDISGIETPDDYTVVFHLSGKGWGDLVGALVLPASGPVPEAYAKQFDSVKGQSTYGQHVLATGPYMIKTYKPGKTIELVRNPNWDSSTDFRPAYLDSITFDEGNADASVATRRIVQGNSLANGDFAVPPDQLKPLVRGSNKQDLTVTPGAGMRYLGLNTTVKPFDNINVRKAIAAVLDRQAMLTTRGGPLVGSVATHMLYPTVAGFDQAGGFDGPGYDFLKNPQGDLNLAMEYMKKAGYPSGKYTDKKPILMVGVNSGGGKSNAEVAQRSISKLGFNVKLREVDSGTMYTKYCQVPKAKVPICPNLGWIKDYADAGTIISPLWSPANIVPAGNVNFSQYKDPELQKEIEAAAALPGGAARVKAWADLDKKITGLALGVPYLWDNTPNVASSNVLQINQAWNAGQLAADWSSLKG